MSLHGKDHVHRLIRTMNAAERRYYKLHLARNAGDHGSKQELLFDTIAQMDEYDETALLEKFKSEPFVRHFAIAKRRLYEGMLRSLSSFHAESSADAKLHRMLHQVELLHQRALYEDASKILRSARRLAEQHERNVVLVAIGEWERRLIECRNYNGTDEAHVDGICDRDRNVLADLAALEELWRAKSKVLIHLYQYGHARTREAEDRLNALLGHPALQDAGQLKSAKARFLFHHVHGAAAFATGNVIACRDHLLQNLDLLSKERARFADEPNLVLGVLSNLTYVCIRSGHIDEAFAHLKRFRTIPSEWGMPESEDLDLKIFNTTASLEMSIHLRLGETVKAKELIPRIERGLDRHEGTISPLRAAAFRYQIAYTHFIDGDIPKALRVLNQLLNDIPAEDASDAICFGRLLQLLLLWELGKADVLRFTLRNTERFLRTRSRKHRFEPLLIQLVRDLSKPKSEAKMLLEVFRSKATEMQADPFEATVFDHFDPVAWAESKLGGESFAHCIRMRVERKNAAA